MKFAFIAPRYGAEITYGPEHICRLMAEQVAERHDVDVLTTCARGDAWKNGYPEGADRIRGVLVRRFAAVGGRETEAFRALGEKLFTTAHARADELQWVQQSGTCSPALIEFLKRQHRNYDGLVFFSHCAGTTVHGLPVAPERSALFPCASPDPSLRFYVCQDALGLPAALGYCSAAERRLVRAYARRPARGEEIVGIGVEAVPEARYPRLQEDTPAAEEIDDTATPEAEEQTVPHLSGRGVLFRRRHRLHGAYVLYGGTVATDNGTEELFEYFDSYTAQDGDTALVLMGVKLMMVPSEPWLRLAGVLPERDRMAALEAADVTVAPDPDDVAGEQVLESLAVGTPVLASARSLAAVEHCRRSNGGLYYSNREEFVEALRLMMMNDRVRAALGRNGRRYVQQHYRWDAVLARFERLVSKLRTQKS